MSLFKKKLESFQGIYYIDEENKPTLKITDRCYFLEKVKMSGFFYRTRLSKALEYFKKQYPKSYKFIKLL